MISIVPASEFRQVKYKRKFGNRTTKEVESSLRGHIL